MSLIITSLNSGSNANCYYIGNGEEAILVDAGLSCRETEKRMSGLGLAMDMVKAIFVSHEHADHITGIPGLSRKYQLPVYITQPTLINSRIPIQEHLVRDFQKNKTVTVGKLSIFPFFKNHDAADPHSFLVSSEGINVGIFTDIGHCCKEVIRYFALCDAVFLESNYCVDMLERGAYPYFLKQRITSGRGHLSNMEALSLFEQHRSPALQYLILSHLSKQNNSPELVERLFREKAGTTNVIVASRYAAMPLLTLHAGNNKPVSVASRRMLRKIPNEQQLSLF